MHRNPAQSSGVSFFQAFMFFYYLSSRACRSNSLFPVLHSEFFPHYCSVSSHTPPDIHLNKIQVDIRWISGGKWDRGDGKIPEKRNPRLNHFRLYSGTDNIALCTAANCLNIKAYRLPSNRSLERLKKKKNKI
jgi:hypothetical protein